MLDEELALAIPGAEKEKEVWPFFFTPEIYKCQTESATKKKQVLLGGRGTGKTTFLKVAASISQPSKIVHGRDWQTALEELRAYGKHPSGWLMIDDLDRLVSRWRTKNRDANDEFQFVLEIAVQKAREEGCLVTSTVPLDEVIFPTDASSLFFQSFHQFQIKWWKKDWPAVLQKQFAHRYSQVQRGVGMRLGAIPTCVPAPDLFEWTRLTGGHPALVSAGMAELLRLIETPEPCTPTVSDEAGDELSKYISAYLLRHSMGPVRRLLQALEAGDLTVTRMSADVQQRAAAALKELARKAPGEGAVLPVKIAATLERAGFVVPISEAIPERWDLAGALLREEILSDFAAEERTPAVSITPSRELPHSQGFLVLETTSESICVSLAGGPWRIARTLVAKMPETVPIQSLMVECDFNTDRALRSALKRLRVELAEVGVESAIKNDWGAGYRLVPVRHRSVPHSPPP